MKKIRLDLKDRSYDIRVGKGALGLLPGVIRGLKPKGPVVVITDKVVDKKTSKITSTAFKPLAETLIKITVPSGERSKSIDVFGQTARKVAVRTKGHKPLIVALGGGVVGDLAGFIAASYRRGVPLIQIPTTLLSQVDASVGGKVGIDLSEAKNLIGAFYQPKAVLVDTEFLKTLPSRHIRNGMAEVIKYGIIEDRSLFELLEKEIKHLIKLRSRYLEQVIYKCLCIKARFVEQDEHDDRDIRIALNYGHTLGHGIETAAEYTNKYNHGESIAVGMIMAAEISAALGICEKHLPDRIKNVVRDAGLPVRVKGLPAKDILGAHTYDKKFVSGRNRFVLPVCIGKWIIQEDIPGSLIKQILKRYVTI